MSNERRNDIGVKIMMAAFGVIIGIFFNVTYNISKEAYGMATENRKEIAVNQECIRNMKDMLSSANKKLDLLLGNR